MWAELSGVWQNCFLPTKGACHGLWITVTVFLMFISYRAHTFFYLTSFFNFLAYAVNRERMEARVGGERM